MHVPRPAQDVAAAAGRPALTESTASLALLLLLVSTPTRSAARSLKALKCSVGAHSVLRLRGGIDWLWWIKYCLTGESRRNSHVWCAH